SAWVCAAGCGWLQGSASRCASTRSPAADYGGTGTTEGGNRLRSAARPGGARDDRRDDAPGAWCASLRLLRHRVSRDDAGGGERISTACGGARGRGTAVRISRAFVRIGCVSDAPCEQGSVPAPHGDRASGKRVQRDRVHRRQVGGYDDGADADRRRGDGHTAGRSRSRRDALPAAPAGRDGGGGGGVAEP